MFPRNINAFSEHLASENALKRITDIGQNDRSKQSVFRDTTYEKCNAKMKKKKEES